MAEAWPLGWARPAFSPGRGQMFAETHTEKKTGRTILGRKRSCSRVWIKYSIRTGSQSTAYSHWGDHWDIFFRSSSDGRTYYTVGWTIGVSRRPTFRKTPPPQSSSEDILADGDPSQVNPIWFEFLSPKLMERIPLRCTGSAGPSGLDADTWHRIFTTFKGASTNMCRSLANMARLMSTEVVDSVVVEPFIACRLITLDKQPGVRPVGVCEVAWRVVAKAILQVVGKDVEEACGFLQKCSGLPAGMQAAVQAMQQMFEDKSVEGILLVDAKNTFNNLNREAALHNTRHLCLSLLVALQNCYQAESRLFVHGGGELCWREGTSQGDPLSMPFYALAIVPLLRQYKKSTLRFDRHGSLMTPRVLDVYAHYVTGGTPSPQWVLPMDMTPTAWKRFS